MNIHKAVENLHTRLKTKSKTEAIELAKNIAQSILWQVNNGIPPSEAFNNSLMAPTTKKPKSAFVKERKSIENKRSPLQNALFSNQKKSKI